MSFNPARQFMAGFSSPIQSARFFKRNIGLLFLGALVHIAILIGYGWCVQTLVIEHWLPAFSQSFATSEPHAWLIRILNSSFANFIIWIFFLFAYGILGISLVNTIASPLFDIMAKRAFSETSGQHVPHEGLVDFFTSFISELTKTFFIFALFFISIFVTFFAPILFLLSVWYLGWNLLDRTLLLLDLTLRQRILYGLKNFFVCLGLGVWCYIPFFAVLFSFSTAAAGAIAVAKNNFFNTHEKLS